MARGLGRGVVSGELGRDLSLLGGGRGVNTLVAVVGARGPDGMSFGGKEGINGRESAGDAVSEAFSFDSELIRIVVDEVVASLSDADGITLVVDAVDAAVINVSLLVEVTIPRLSKLREGDTADFSWLGGGGTGRRSKLRDFELEEGISFVGKDFVERRFMLVDVDGADLSTLCDDSEFSMICDGTCFSTLCDETRLSMLCEGTCFSTLCDETRLSVLCDGDLKSESCKVGNTTLVLASICCDNDSSSSR